MKHYIYILLLALFTIQCRPKEENNIIQFSGKSEVPLSIKKEHESLLNQARKLTLFKDSSGISARKLYDLIQHHFTEEEKFVLPHLGLLPLLANGNIPDESREIIELS